MVLRYPNDIGEWRGYDLRPRVRKLIRAFSGAPVMTPEDVPILVNTPCYFAFGTADKPQDYFDNPASMWRYQADGYARHLSRVSDDIVPYFMPWYGTGVLASAFGCEIRRGQQDDDPAVAGPCIHSPADAAALRLPAVGRAGWMPRVLDAIDYAVSEGDLPVGLTDMQGPLDTLGLMCGQAQLYQWMYSEPRMVHDLMALVTSAFIEWVRVQKAHIGEPLDSSHGLQGVFSPGVGVWESADDLVLLDPGLYREFVAPYVTRLLTAFGGGSIHFCGNGLHQIETLAAMPGLKVVNNSPLGDFAAFGTLKRRLSGRAVIEIQDGAPLDPEVYYPRLFNEVNDLSGLILAPFVIDSVAMDLSGGYVPVNRDPFETANRIVAVSRACFARVLSGEPCWNDQEPARVVAVAKPPSPAGGPRPDLSDEQRAALEHLQDRLLEFDGPGLAAAVQSALNSGLRPLDIVLQGMAAGMKQVGQLYEDGEFFLPQLVMAGATMKHGMAVLEPLLQEARRTGGKGTVVLGTVQGDLHDIGKNLVGMMLQGAGFVVVDLGVDVAPQKFVEAAQAHQAQIVALSALLTTTMPNMGRAVDMLRQGGLGDRVKVMIGGAPLSQAFADQIGAHGYAPDAIKAIAEAERLLTLS